MLKLLAILTLLAQASILQLLFFSTPSPVAVLAKSKTGENQISIPQSLPPTSPTTPPLPGKPARLIIKFRPLTPQFLKKRLLNRYQLPTPEYLQLPNTLVTQTTPKQLPTLIQKLSQSLFVDYAEPDFIVTALTTPNDPYFSNQWGLTQIQAPTAWDITQGSPDVDIAILDTGISQNHPDLKDKITTRANFTLDPDTDTHGHGTHVAGIASATTNNSLGIAGTSWQGRLMSVKVLNNQGSGYHSWVANGIIWATNHGAEVINLSLGSPFSSRTLKTAIKYAWNQGVVIAAAAGNDSSQARTYPAYYPQSIATAATNQNDLKADFSNYGSWVDVAAPGTSIFSTYIKSTNPTHQGNYAYLSGTSMSTPFVAGLAALLSAQHPDWTNTQIRNQIEATADPIEGTGLYWAYGRINACAALNCNPSPTLSPTPTPTPTATPTPPLLPTLTPTPIPTSTPAPTPSPTPSPSPTPITTRTPWWCTYIPRHRFCQP